MMKSAWPPPYKEAEPSTRRRGRLNSPLAKNRDAVLWAAMWAVAGIETRVVGRELLGVAASGDAAVRLATLYVPISTTRAALNTRQRGAKATGFLKFLEGGKGRGRHLKEAEEACGGGRDEGALRLVGLEEEGVKILEAGTEL